jgi:hypothetical protein
MKLLVGSALILLALIVFVFYSPIRMFAVYPPGWELYNQVGGLKHLHDIYSEQSDFTSGELYGVYWKVELDEPDYGVPDIQVMMGDIQHVDFMGQPIPSDEPADTITVTRGNRSYYLDYHIYSYTVTIRTIADTEVVGVGDVWGCATIHHETSFPHTYKSIGETWGTEVGEKFDGGVYVKFIIDPWKGYTYRDPPPTDNPDEEWYELDNCWAGVMNTYVLAKQVGQIENKHGETPPDEDGDLFVKGALAAGNQVPMLIDDGIFGTPAPQVDWDPTIQPDTRIESSVVQFLPVEMFPGADAHFNFWKCMDGIRPCDVYVMYTLRVDVLTTHGFLLHTAQEPPTPVPPTDYFTWFDDTWDNIFHAIGLANPFSVFGEWSGFVAFLFTLALIFLVVFILLLLLRPGMVVRSATALGKARRGYLESSRPI